MALIGKGAIQNDKDQTIRARPAALPGAGSPLLAAGKAFPIVGGPVFAILAGMVVTIFYRSKASTQAGIAYTSKKILQYAVILLGFGLNLSEIAKVGAPHCPSSSPPFPPR